MRGLFCLVVVLSLCAGCGTFEREWNRVSHQPALTNEIAGRWTGEWRSEKNNHHGKLRCIITPHGGEAYMARFHAVFWKIFTANYMVPLNATNVNGEYHFTGSANLGGLGGGTYTYEGNANAEHFHSTYKSKHDEGVFEMKRPAPKDKY
jgi:hypothetical protein